MLKARIAKVLGWTERDAAGFSLAALRELVRPLSPKLAAEVDEAIRTGSVVLK